MWDGIPPKSRAALTEENGTLRAHLINLGWDEEMLQSTAVKSFASRSADLAASMQEGRPPSDQVSLDLKAMEDGNIACCSMVHAGSLLS